MWIPCMAESSLWTRFLVVSVEDMLPTAYVDARTTKFCFRDLFLAVPFLACQKSSEKISAEWLFLHKKVSTKRHISVWEACWLAAFALLALASYHQAADVVKADDQTWVTSGSFPPWACQEITLGVYSTTVPTLLQVALWGPWGAYPTVNDQQVAMPLTWPWWSLEDSLLAGTHIISHSPKKKFSILY